MDCGHCFCSLVIRYFLYWAQQGVIIFHDVFDNEHEVGGAQIKVEGVYIWPFRQLRMVANRYNPGLLPEILSSSYYFQ